MVIVHLDAAQVRRTREHNARAWLAWNVAALMRERRLPPLKTLLIEDGPPRRKSVAELMATARVIGAAMGGARQPPRRRRRN